MSGTMENLPWWKAVVGSLSPAGVAVPGNCSPGVVLNIRPSI